jgi:hypothetical protein
MKYTGTTSNSNLHFPVYKINTLKLAPLSILSKYVNTTPANRRQYCSTSPPERVKETALMVIDKPPSVPSETCLYKNIVTIENLELGLKRTKSGISAGLDGEVKANYLDSKKLIALSEKLKTHKYKPSPTKKV